MDCSVLEPSAAPVAGSRTRCLTWPLSERRAGVRCFSPAGKPIQCCGHGLLSCAMLWSARWHGDGSLEYGSTEIPTQCVDSLYWVGFPAVALQRENPLPGITQLLPVQPDHCAIAGPEGGYLITELPAGSNLVALQPPGAALRHVTRRALIVTCALDDDTLGVDVEFRYFAPQYGSGEDVATGSAMRLLAQYWKQRGLGDRISALQRSPEGGLLHSRIEGARTWVGGRVIDE